MHNRRRAMARRSDDVLSLQVLARRSAPEDGETTHFRELLRHSLQRFFAVGASDGENARLRLIQTAFALGLPGFVLALYLYPAYHLPLQAIRPWWSQAGDHFFYVLYAMAAMGLVTVFEWDLFFPDTLDIFILSTLPVRNGMLFRARIAAIVLLLGAVLLDSNLLAPLVLPAATDPPHLFRFLAAHLAAVFMAGIFTASALLALEGLLLAWLGERLFRSLSLWLQTAAVVLLLSMLFLYPILFGALPSLTGSGDPVVIWLPPFWFLGIYQSIVAGSAAPEIFARLAHAGCAATLISVFAAILAYPLAWWRKTQALVEGTARREGEISLAVPANELVHATLVRKPGARAIWHFIAGNLMRVPRYRMILVLYGGAGLALIFASVARLAVSGSHLRFFFSPGGLSAAIPVVAFWTVSGLRSTFLATAEPRGRWIFGVTVGNTAPEALWAMERWVFCCSALATVAAATLKVVAIGSSTLAWSALIAPFLTAISLSLLLTDAFFLNVTTIPFTGARATSATNFALLLIPYLGFFPAVVVATAAVEPWIARRGSHLIAATALALAAHLTLRFIRSRRIAERLQQVIPDEDEEEFPLRLGLRY